MAEKQLSNKPTETAFKNRDKETFFLLTWSATEEFVRNAYKSKKRWIRSFDVWDLYCYFVALHSIFDNCCLLNPFGKYDNELGKILRNYRKLYTSLEIGYFRNHGIHREKSNNLKNSKGRKVESTIFIIGGFNVSKNEFTFLDQTINLDHTYKLIETFRRDIRNLLKKRRTQYYSKRAHTAIEGIIPFTHIHGLYAEPLKSKKHKYPPN